MHRHFSHFNGYFYSSTTLSSLAKDCGATAYVNDAFGAAHRAHASTAGIVNFIDGPHVAGKLMQKEVDFLYGCVEAPEKPLAAVIGGAKVSTKLPVLESLIPKCEKIFIGGGMIFTFYKVDFDHILLYFVSVE